MNFRIKRLRIAALALAGLMMGTAFTLPVQAAPTTNTGQGFVIVHENAPCPTSSSDLQQTLRKEKLDERLAVLKQTVRTCGPRYTDKGHTPALWVPFTTTQLRVVLRDFPMADRFSAFHTLVKAGESVYHGEITTVYSAVSSTPYGRTEMVDLLREFDTTDRSAVLYTVTTYGEKLYVIDGRYRLRVAPKWCHNVTPTNILGEFDYADRNWVQGSIRSTC